jgi:hypothetical protein
LHRFPARPDKIRLMVFTTTREKLTADWRCYA